MIPRVALDLRESALEQLLLLLHPVDDRLCVPTRVSLDPTHSHKSQHPHRQTPDTDADTGTNADSTDTVGLRWLHVRDRNRRNSDTAGETGLAL